MIIKVEGLEPLGPIGVYAYAHFEISTLAFVLCLAKKRTARVADENLYSPTQTSSPQLTNL